jgi:hypothetical protein
MVHGWSKHLDNLLSLPPDRQIRRYLAMFYDAGSGDPARAMTILRYPVNHAGKSIAKQSFRSEPHPWGDFCASHAHNELRYST